MAASSATASGKNELVVNIYLKPFVVKYFIIKMFWLFIGAALLSRLFVQIPSRWVTNSVNSEDKAILQELFRHQGHFLMDSTDF